MSDTAKADAADGMPQPGSRWQHRGTKGTYRVLFPQKGRLSGSGEWRDGVAYESEADGNRYWRCLRSWEMSFDRLPDATPAAGTEWEDCGGALTRDAFGVRLWASPDRIGGVFHWQADAIGGPEDDPPLKEGTAATVEAAMEAAEAWAAKERGTR